MDAKKGGRDRVWEALFDSPHSLRRSGFGSGFQGTAHAQATAARRCESIVDTLRFNAECRCARVVILLLITSALSTAGDPVCCVWNDPEASALA